MANQNFFQKFGSLYTDKSINGWVRGLMWVGTGAVIVIVGKTAYGKIFPSQSEKNAKSIAENINNSIDEQTAAGQSPTYPIANYDAFADTIYNSGHSWGHINDSFSSIKSTLEKMQKDLDVSLLMKSFGTRDNKDLFAFVNESFAARWFGVVNFDRSSVNDDWESKGITYRL